MTDANGVVLVSDGLLSKYGFNDGDMPDEVWDYLEGRRADVDALAVDWRSVLRLLVRRHVLPALAAAGHVVEVYDIETIHNPIRAGMIDGHLVDAYEDNDGIKLRPESVLVSWDSVLEAIRQLPARADR